MISRFALAAICLSCLGCRLDAPIHVWQPPQLVSTVGKRVVVTNVAGPEDVSEPLRKQLIAEAPSDVGRATSILPIDSLPPEGPIRLVSAFDGEPNDLAVASLARRSGADFLLRGEVMEDRQTESPPHRNERLKVSWRLLSLERGGDVAGMPTVVDSESMVERYPDLGRLASNDARLIAATVRDAYRLMAPWIDRQTVTLSVPFGLPGSREVRRGNLAARNGRWGEAGEIWETVWKDHPTQVAALHNSALAAAAAQDFSRAKTLARRAVRLSPIALHKETLIWIELMQRDYHESFDLADPPEGWFLVRSRADAS